MPHFLNGYVFGKPSLINPSISSLLSELGFDVLSTDRIDIFGPYFYLIERAFECKRDTGLSGAEITEYRKDGILALEIVSEDGVNLRFYSCNNNTLEQLEEEIQERFFNFAKLHLQ